MSTIDVNDVQLIQQLATSSGISVADVREVIELCRGDEFKIRNHLQNLIVNRAIDRKVQAN